MKKKKKDKWQFQSYKNNMALMVFVCHRLEQQKAFDDFDQKYHRLNAELIQKEKPIRWSSFDRRLYVDQKFLDRLDQETRDTIYFIIQNMGKDFESILAKVNLPVHFYEHLWNYVAYNKITAPSFNFALEFHPLDSKTDRAKISAGGTQYITINVYSPLTIEEKALAFKLLDGMARTSFPEYIKKRFSSKDVNREIKIVEEAARFRRAKIKTEYYGYMKIQQKKYQEGKTSEKELKRIMKLNPDDIAKTREPSITSKKVAKKLGLTSQNVRTIKSRHKKKVDRYFNLA